MIATRLEKLRHEMSLRGLDALIVFHSDPHLSEYMHGHFKCREWLSGFSGSYGFMVVTKSRSALWTDSRYTVQAAMQLKGTEIEIIQDRLPDTLHYTNWLKQEFTTGAKVGMDSRLVSIQEYQYLSEVPDFEWIDCGDLFAVIADDRDRFLLNEVMDHPVTFSGKAREEKIEELRTFMKSHHMDHYVVSALDEIAWLLNLRGSDIPYNPVFYSYVIVSDNKIILFSNGGMDSLLSESLDVMGVEIKAYDLFYDTLSQLSGTVGLDASKATQKIVFSLKSEPLFVSSPITTAKAIKNDVELKGAEEAHVEDAKALFAFWKWLDENQQKGYTEYEIGRKVNEFRSVSSSFVQDSFAPIVGFNENGAIVHYSASEESKSVKGNGMLLIDSGGQYLMGTTDITRTYAIGTPSNEMKEDYTRVLKGMIALSKAVFPKGYAGCHLDILARTALLAERTNYGHGTGHGVGSYLNVHEGPMSIRPDYNQEPLCPGQVLSNEPGVYREGAYGIRIENLISVVEDVINEFGPFYSFKTLTLFPIDLKLVAKELLTKEEIQWVNDYHDHIRKELSNKIDNSLKDILQSKTMHL